MGDNRYITLNTLIDILLQERAAGLDGETEIWLGSRKGHLFSVNINTDLYPESPPFITLLTEEQDDLINEE